jgi:hypothetical protein
MNMADMRLVVYIIIIIIIIIIITGRDSSVGIVTRYGLDDLGIESQWVARFSAPVQTGPGTHRLLYNGNGVFPGAKEAGAWR